MPPLTILSCGIDPVPDSFLFSNWGQWADEVYGASKLLNLSSSFETKGIRLGSDARQKAQEALESSRSGKNILLLASGDALFHGIGGTIHSLRTEEDKITFIPAETAFQALFHRLGLPWDKAQLFSTHFSQEAPLAEILSSQLAVVYGGTSPTGTDLARLCIEWLPSCSERKAVLAENLGTDEEIIRMGTLAELSREKSCSTSLLVLLPPNHTNQSPRLPLGLDNDLYAKENSLITGEEIRAVILSKLALPAWGTLWDIGAGSGAIGLEAAGLRPNLQVYGLEKNESRLAMIEGNKARMARINYTLHQGTAPDDLDILPPPDRIFIGGGGADLQRILNECYDKLASGGRMVVSSVTIESLQILYSWHPERRASFLELTVAKEQSLAGKYHHLQLQNRISLFTFSKP
ncbi:MAG: precorrin-6Y C5,15-methyltransferase (decarboxylating) subunit CbiT [Akkermansia sp.]